jgi:hypothetical protein
MNETDESFEVKKEKAPLTKTELKDHAISQSIAKRKDWAKQFNLSERTIFDLFSEFTCMKMIAKAEQMHKVPPQTNAKYGGLASAFPVSEQAKMS